MAFKQVCTSLLVAVACCTVLSQAQQLSYLSDNNQNGLPFTNQGSFTYLRDNGANQAVYPYPSGPINYINNIAGNPQIQTIDAYSNVISSVGNNGLSSSNIINTVNTVNSGLSPVYQQSLPVYEQSLPVYQQSLPVYQQSLPVYQQSLPVYNQFVSYPSVVQPNVQYVQQL